MFSFKKKITKIILIFLLVFVLSSCIRQSDKKIKIDGSATVMPITQSIVEDFSINHRDIEISLAVSGTGGGFSKFSNGEIDILNASRLVKQKELDMFSKNNISHTEIAIAKDAIVVAVNKQNNFIKNVSADTLRNIFEVDSKINRWCDIDESFPDEKIQFFVPARTSGTYEYFTSKISPEKKQLRHDVTCSQDLNLLMKGVQGNKNGIGFFSFAYYLTEQSSITALSIDNVEPVIDQISNNKYKPLTRNLYLYINNENYRSKLSVREFIEYYFSYIDNTAKEQGYIPLTSDEYLTELSKIEKLKNS